MISTVELRRATSIMRRRVQQAVGQRLDLVENVAENSRFWRLRRQQRQHFLDVVDETHVEHAVGFVQDQDFDVLQVSVPCWRGRAGGPAWRRGCRRLACSCLICGLMPTPPKITAEFRFRYLP
jgi:hypothetical protein